MGKVVHDTLGSMFAWVEAESPKQVVECSDYQVRAVRIQGYVHTKLQLARHAKVYADVLGAGELHTVMVLAPLHEAFPYIIFGLEIYMRSNSTDQ